VYATAKAKHDKVIKMRDKLVNKMLSTLKSLKHESIRPNFKEIIQKKLGVAPCVNLQSEEVTTKMEYTLAGYEMCWMFFKRTVFRQDTVEQQLNYILYHLKKPKWLSARMFVSRLGQINNYV
jgi:hypothetical protein